MSHGKMRGATSKTSEEKINLKVGERVLWYGDREKAVKGTVRWVGKIQEMTDDYVGGVELDEPYGSGDGCWNHERYFKCKDKHAIIVNINALLRVSDMGDYSSSDSEETEEYETSFNDLSINEPSNWEEIDDVPTTIEEKLVKNLEKAINEGSVTTAAELAKQLASFGIKCKIMLKEEARSNVKSKIDGQGTKHKSQQNRKSVLRLNVTVEFEDGDEKQLNISVDELASILDVKNEIRSLVNLQPHQLQVFSGDMKTMHQNDIFLKNINHQCKIIAVEKSGR